MRIDEVDDDECSKKSEKGKVFFSLSEITMPKIELDSANLIIVIRAIYIPIHRCGRKSDETRLKILQIR